MKTKPATPAKPAVTPLAFRAAAVVAMDRKALEDPRDPTITYPLRLLDAARSGVYAAVMAETTRIFNRPDPCPHPLRWI